MSLPVFLSVLKENFLQVVSAKSRFSLDKQMWHRQANIVPSWCDADMCCEYHVSLDVSLRILPRCKKQRTAENSREHTTSLGSIGQSRQLAATSPCSPQELSVGSSNKGERLKISFDLRKRPCLNFSHSVLLCPCISWILSRATPGLLICLHSLIPRWSLS